jgi:hypothetical protein
MFFCAAVHGGDSFIYDDAKVDRWLMPIDIMKWKMLTVALLPDAGRIKKNGRECVCLKKK